MTFNVSGSPANSDPDIKNMASGNLLILFFILHHPIIDR
ncbi:hypothetical protein FHR25_004481 [Yokenella regensburgei]|nr:hypothetical protein FHR25_004481 [Yokenella regensburgei]